MRKQLAAQNADESVVKPSNEASLATLIATKRTLTDELETTNVERMERVKAKLASVMVRSKVICIYFVNVLSIFCRNVLSGNYEKLT